MKTRSILAASLLATLSSTATAQVWFPAEGIWQIDGANGSGLTLDVRDNTIGIGLYTYDGEGKGTWYSGAGALVDGVLSAELTQYARGANDTPAAIDTIDMTLTFQASAAGTLSLGGGETHAVRHFAFGAEYVDGLALTGASGDVTVIPNLVGRWVFSATGPDGFGSADVQFIGAANADQMVTFDTLLPALPNSGPRHLRLICQPQEASQPGCALIEDFALTTPPRPEEEVARFDPADLSATRIAGAPDGVVGFRVFDGGPSASEVPHTGIWQITGRFGEGITLDIRPDLVAIGVFGYDDAGNATWSLATGPRTDGVVEADLLTFSGGNCIDCEPADATVSDTRPLRLEFVGTTRARLTIGDDDPLAVSLLPYGSDYLDTSLAGDPLADEFGEHPLPALAGAWVKTDASVSMTVGRSTHPTGSFVFDDVETISIGDRLAALLAFPDEVWSAPSGFGASTGASLACEAGVGDDAGSCRLYDLGNLDTPPTEPRSIAAFKPWNIAPMRMSGNVTGVVPFPVHVFRIPPRPATAPAE